jgi:hypothetical protein
VFFQLQVTPDGKKATASLNQVGMIQRADVMPRLAKSSHLLHSLRVIPNRHDQVAYIEFYFKTPIRARASAEVRKDRQLIFEFEKR